MNGKFNNGVFVISLDLELFWGMRDHRTLSECQKTLDGVRDAVFAMLQLFDKYGIHATWGAVGFLFASCKQELKKYLPDIIPDYVNGELSPYDYIEKNNIDDKYHFAPDIIKEILQYKNQEIATHTFSHYYCREQGASREAFDDDLKSAIKIASDHGIDVKSIIFPRNQWRKDYLPILTKRGIISYRGNAAGWLYRDGDGSSKTLIKRAFILSDTYINLSGNNSYSFFGIKKEQPYNIPASFFMRLLFDKIKMLENMRKKRIINSIEYAAKHNKIFHLWWHPHNLGTNLTEKLNYLEDILVFYKKMNKLYGMRSLNMRDIADNIIARKE